MDSSILEQITDAWPHGMIVLDNECRVMHWNQWMERTSGIAGPDALGTEFSGLFEGGTVAPRLLMAVNSALLDGTSSILTRTFTPHAMPLFRDHTDGVLMVQSIRVRSVRSAEGDRLCMLDIHDETASAKRDAMMNSQQEALKKHSELLAQANADLDAFVHHAGHDLRAPLRGIEAFLVLLRQDLGEEISEDAATDLEHVERCTHHLGTILEDLLTISRMSHKEMVTETVDMDRCLDAAIEAVTSCLVDSEFIIERDAWPVVNGDRRMLEHLVQNLVENALHHRSKNDGLPLLKFTFENRDGAPVFGVQDNGPGISEKHQREMWTPFKSLSSFHRGSGLGLAICRQVVDRHEGRLWCSSTAGSGAHFQFTLEGAGSL